MNKYYNKTLVNEIAYQIDVENYQKALNLVEDYIIEYPRDALAPFYKAVALAGLGQKEEALTIAHNAMEFGFHDIKATINAYTWYGDVLTTCGFLDEAIASYSYVLKLEQPGTYCLKARNGLVKIYIGRKEYDKALEIVEDPEVGDTNIFYAKKANIYICTGRYKEALKILSEHVDKRKKHDEQYVNLLYGKCYYYMHKYTKAIEYLKKCLGTKNLIYYKALYYISQSQLESNHFREALQTAQKFKNVPALCNDACKVLFKVYIKLGNLELAKEQINKTTSETYRAYLQAYYDYTIGNFKEAAEEIVYVLHNDTVGLFQRGLTILVQSLLRMGKIDEAEYILDNCDSELIKELVVQMRSYIASQKNKLIDTQGLYTCEQLLSYNRDKALEHIIDHHNENGTHTYLGTDDEITGLFEEIPTLIDGMNPISNELFDKYVIPCDKVSSSKNDYCDTLLIITMPKTKDIITMYPLVGLGINRKYEKHKVVKAKSGLDRFKSRYGLK